MSKNPFGATFSGPAVVSAWDAKEHGARFTAGRLSALRWAGADLRPGGGRAFSLGRTYISCVLLVVSDNGSQPGYIAIARKAFESGWWLEARSFSRWEAWVDLIQMAGWHKRTWMLPGGAEIELGRGETPPISLSFLAKRWGWTIKQGRGFIHIAISNLQIRAHQKTQQGHTYILVNYNRYQPGGHSEGHTEGHGEGTVRAQRGHENEEGKEGKAGKQTKPPRSRASSKTPTNNKPNLGSTWLTPYLDEWKNIYGGDLPPKRAAAGLGPLHTQHGDAEVLPRWQYYLEQHRDKPGIATPQGFAQTYGSWEPRAEPMSQYSIDPDTVER